MAVLASALIRSGRRSVLCHVPAGFARRTTGWGVAGSSSANFSDMLFSVGNQGNLGNKLVRYYKESAFPIRGKGNFRKRVGNLGNQL